MSDERVERAVRADGRDVRAALVDGDRHGELLARHPTRRRGRGPRAGGPGRSRTGRSQRPVRARRQPAGARGPRPGGPAGGAWPLRTTDAGRRRSTRQATRWRRRPVPPRRPGPSAARGSARWSDTARPGRCPRGPCRAAGSAGSGPPGWVVESTGRDRRHRRARSPTRCSAGSGREQGVPGRLRLRPHGRRRRRWGRRRVGAEGLRAGHGKGVRQSSTSGSRWRKRRLALPPATARSSSSGSAPQVAASTSWVSGQEESACG